jgi:hypothetical protein
VTSGNLRFGEALEIFEGRLLNNGALKPRTKEFRKERIQGLNAGRLQCLQIWGDSRVVALLCTAN